jgi:hypothetical protein
MATIATDVLTSARDATVAHLFTRAEVVAGLEQLHDLVLAVCPECLLKLRGPPGGGMVYIPPERAHATQRKNLLTISPEALGVRIRIMPNPEEMYDAGKGAEYLNRLERRNWCWSGKVVEAEPLCGRGRNVGVRGGPCGRADHARLGVGSFVTRGRQFHHRLNAEKRTALLMGHTGPTISGRFPFRGGPS